MPLEFQTATRHSINTALLLDQQGTRIIVNKIFFASECALRVGLSKNDDEIVID